MSSVDDNHGAEGKRATSTLEHKETDAQAPNSRPHAWHRCASGSCRAGRDACALARARRHGHGLERVRVDGDRRRGQQPPPSASLSFAMTQGAVYDAVEGIDAATAPIWPRRRRRRTDSEDAAAANAALGVLTDALPAPVADACSRVTTRRSPPSPTAPAQAPAARRTANRPGRRCSPRAPYDGRAGSVHARHRDLLPARGAPPRRDSRKDPTPWVASSGRSSSPTSRCCGRGAEPVDQPRLRARSQRDQVGRRAPQHQRARADQTDAAICWQDHATRCGTASCVRWATSRDLRWPPAPGCSRWPTSPPPMRRSAAGTRSTTGTSGARSPPSARRTPTATRDRG